jgi:cell division protease FtsH
MGHQRDYSEDVAALVDEEVKRFISYAHQEAFDILVQNRDVLDHLVTELLEKETIDRKGLADVFSDVRMRPERPAWTGSDTRIPSSLPPVEVPASSNGVRPESAPEITVGPGSEGGSFGAPPSGPPGAPPSGPPLGPPSVGPQD